MRRSVALLGAILIFFTTLAVPSRAFARDELKNDDPDRYYILLDLRNQIVTVFERDENNEYTKVVRRFLCSSGRTDVDEADPEDEATPTPRGIWKIGGRERFGKFANFGGEYARYWVQIVGSIYFHSLLYGKRSVDALKKTPYYDIGSKVSHGCVRLYVEDAKWLYYYACPGTTIEISATEPSNRELRKALKSKLSFSEYNAFQKTISDETEELPNRHAWVTVPGARMRKGSGSSFDAVARLAVGDELEVLIESEAWVKVRFEKKEGYVLRGYISYDQNKPDTKEDADILKTTEWLYAAPDEAGERICKMPARVSVNVLETTEDGWTKLQYQNETGYVRSSHLKKGWGVIYQ
ncbi:MAG: SH3 domain-containing protein [Eubacteriales bacterium]|nr:SH3 domain-containing protein [Eubacteriales bacterium]